MPLKPSFASFLSAMVLTLLAHAALAQGAQQMCTEQAMKMCEGKTSKAECQKLMAESKKKPKK